MKVKKKRKKCRFLFFFFFRKSILNKISQLKTVEKELNKVKIVKMTTVCEEIGRQVAQYEGEL